MAEQAVHVQDSQLCEHAVSTTRYKISWIARGLSDSSVDWLVAKNQQQTKNPHKQRETGWRFFFWTVAALIVTIVAVFVNPDIESLVDSEVLSLDWSIKAKQNKTTTQTRPKQNKTKTNQTAKEEAILGKLKVKRWNEAPALIWAFSRLGKTDWLRITRQGQLKGRTFSVEKRLISIKKKRKPFSKILTCRQV